MSDAVHISLRAKRALTLLGFLGSWACGALEARGGAAMELVSPTTEAVPPPALQERADCAESNVCSSPIEATTIGPMLRPVRAGETLQTVAEQYGCSVRELQRFNRSNPYLIRGGNILTIPDCGAGEAGRWSVGREITVDPTPGRRYRTRDGDSLDRIGLRTGCSAEELMEANRYDSDAIFAGGLIEIPTCDGEEAQALTSTPPRSPVDYLVSGSDTLGGIAAYTGCSRRAIRRANRLKDFYVQPGTRLKIPDCSDPNNQPSARAAQRGAKLDTRWLRELMLSEGFHPPKRFKAMVTIIDFETTPDGRKIKGQRRFSYGKTADDAKGWNPASTVKLFSAIAALRRLSRYGFTHESTVEIKGRRDLHAWKVGDLVREALVPSNNIAHNHLVQIAGFDYLNEDFFSTRNGFRHSAIQRAYATRTWREMGEDASLRESPTIVVQEGERRRTIRGAIGTSESECRGACTSLLDLSESIRRVMLDELPKRQRYGLPAATLQFVQDTLRAKRERGEEVVNQLAFEFNDTRVEFAHKAGYSRGWYSDVIYATSPDRSKAFVIALAGFPGRASLSGAAEAIGTLLATERLK